MLTIQKNCVVSFDFTLSDEEGTLMDSSKGQEPLVYLHGFKALIPGLENALEGKREGDDFKVVITPDQAYGNRDEDLVYEIDREEVAHLPNLNVGMELEVDSDDESVVMTIVQINDNSVVLDANHPLAGVTLNFDIQVLNVRQATADEISHGHVHGPGGHHH